MYQGDQPVNREKPFVYDCQSGFLIRERFGYQLVYDYFEDPDMIP